jgi:hypothetical protein
MLARVFVLGVVVSATVMVVPFVLLTCSNLHGPNCVELRFQDHELEQTSGGDCSEDLWDCHDDVEGAIVVMQEDVGASCELGRSGVATAIGLGVWPFILLVQAFFLSSKANKLEADSENNAKNRAAVSTPPVTEVNDKHDHEDEDEDEDNDATVDESLEKDETSSPLSFAKTCDDSSTPTLALSSCCFLQMSAVTIVQRSRVG